MGSVVEVCSTGDGSSRDLIRSCPRCDVSTGLSQKKQKLKKTMAGCFGAPTVGGEASVPMWDKEAEEACQPASAVSSSHCPGPLKTQVHWLEPLCHCSLAGRFVRVRARVLVVLGMRGPGKCDSDDQLASNVHQRLPWGPPVCSVTAWVCLGLPGSTRSSELCF